MDVDEEPSVPGAAPGGVKLDAHIQLNHSPLHVVSFGGEAGKAIEGSTPSAFSGYKLYASEVDPGEKNLYAPFASRLDWELAQWAKLRGPSSTAFTELLAIEGVYEQLGLSYKNTDKLNRIVDNKLPNRRPAFCRCEALVGGEKFTMFCRDILECARALWGDAEHTRYLCITPERHYADANQTTRLYHNLHTGKWWWAIQEKLEEENPGATVMPIILSLDKTQLTMFRNKTAYPVYLTIGNLPKEIRRKPSHRGQILLAYLPTSWLEHIKNKAARRRTLANLFHACMSVVTEPLHKAGIDSVQMTSGDGVTRPCHPVLAVYVGDYPEQVLVTGTYTGDCPICECPHNDLDKYPCTHEPHNVDEALKALRLFRTADYNAACSQIGIKPIQRPFWEQLPYTDIYRSITPDILHQLLQGVIKHLLSWLTDILGNDEIDARVKRLPPNHSIRIFHKGISGLSRITGTEHKQIARFILGLVVDIRLPDGESTEDLVAATKALLDFLYIAQYSVHSTTTLEVLDTALAEFHSRKAIFVNLGARDNFLIPKLHMLLYYTHAIKLYGTTDNYNTESTERLHIDFAKEAYRASNHKNEFPQMMQWLERREKVLQHAKFVKWCMLRAESQETPGQAEPTAADEVTCWRPPDMACTLNHHMTKWPTRNTVSIAELTSADSYGALYLMPALGRFIVELNSPNLTRNQIEERAVQLRFPFTSLPVFHTIKFRNTAYFSNDTLDSIHVRPQRVDSNGNLVAPARFDTALVVELRLFWVLHDGIGLILTYMRVGQVRAIFSLPEKHLHALSPGLPIEVLQHLVYIEWFSKFTTRPDERYQMYKIRRLTGAARIASVVPLRYIERSVHLYPKWGGTAPSHWSSENVLAECSAFYVNLYKEPHSYYNLY
ncbi:hypothetical protein DAEQUDRAFT_678329 [Daedalea quercina L-15889]|uniref:Uncharacterized protein n=1 Tax=Daedalea quercina L-15889 TaxID=1314783 RepID=A0A165LMA0_9APHY|nr:hypothetical protein DAEQUDRAFT_678329 [Daedalea quercina L-15889]